MSEDVSEFDAKILACFNRGLDPAHISIRLRLPTREIRARLAAMGHIETHAKPERSSASIWDMDEDHRREAIRKRAAAGARKARRA